MPKIVDDRRNRFQQIFENFHQYSIEIEKIGNNRLFLDTFRINQKTINFIRLIYSNI